MNESQHNKEQPLAGEGIASFSVAALPRIVFGKGCFDSLAAEISVFGKHVLVVTGGQSFTSGLHWARLQESLVGEGVKWSTVRISGEPGPAQIDSVVSRNATSRFDVVVGIGGGSALDAGKAIAGLLNNGHSVTDFLEGAGTPANYQGPAVPFIAVPTTAGTGSELTRNAVITQPGQGGYKKSFRDDRLLARLALIDPDLLISCPAPVMLGNALDALTQLIESYVSTRASMITDALALDGLKAFARGFRPDPGNPVREHSELAYAAMISGICLTQAGLGSVHGFASPLGAFFSIPHGTACGTMLAVCTDMNVKLLQERTPDNPVLEKYATVANLLAPSKGQQCTPEDLTACLYDWTVRCQLPRLSELGVRSVDFDRIVAASGGNSMKTNPLVLTPNELEKLLRARL